MYVQMWKASLIYIVRKSKVKELFKMNMTEVKKADEKVFYYMIADHTEEAKKMSEKKSAVDGHAGNWGMDIHNWDWNPGVGLTAMSYYYRKTKNKEVLEYLQKWLEINRYKCDIIKAVNATAPYTIYPLMYEETRDVYYLEKSIEHCYWLINYAPRAENGAFQHTVNTESINEKLRNQVWADTIFMSVLFMATVARVSGNTAFASEVMKQLELHIDVLQDPETGVLYHGYNCTTKGHMSGALWARGNAWLTIGIPLIISEIQNLVVVPEEFLQKYRKLVKGLAGFQGENGLWHTVLNHPEYYQETSGSAGIAAGIAKAVKLGLVDVSYQSCAKAGLQGVLGKIGYRGEVNGVSGGTPIMKTIAEYNELTCYTTLYGQGLTLLLLCEFI